MKPNRRKAFTLVELLVVISIIVLLVAMLMPAFSLVYKSMQKLHCQANLKSIHQVMVQYAQTNEGRLPCLGGLTRIQEVNQDKPGVPDGGTPTEYHLMGDALKMCGATPEKFSCPVDPKYGDANDPFWQTWTTFRTDKLNNPDKPDNPKPWPCTYKIIDIIGYVFFAGSDRQQVNPGHRTTADAKYYPGLPAFAASSTGTTRYDKFSIYPDDSSNLKTSGGPLDNLPFARLLDDAKNPPIAADLMCQTDATTYRGFNHCEVDDKGAPLSGGGSTLFLTGNVIWTDWADLEGGVTAKPPTQPLLDWSKRTDWWADECGKYFFASAMNSSTGN